MMIPRWGEVASRAGTSLGMSRKQRTLMRRIGHLIEYVILRGLELVLGLVPYRALDPLSHLIAAPLYPFVGKARRRVLDNLELVFRDWTEAERRKLTRRALRHALRTFLEVMQTRKFSNQQFLDAHLIAEDEDTLRIIQERQAGIVGVQGHFGNWELPLIFYPRHGVPVVFARKHLSNPHVDRHMDRRRVAYGSIPVFVEDSMEILRALRRKAFIGLAADQNARGKGIFVDFMGVPASTFIGPALMAYTTESPLVLCTCCYQGKGVHRIRTRFVVEEVRKSDYESREEAIEILTRKWCEALEAVIREHPEQYLWLHRRWRTRPPSAVPVAHGS